MHKGRIMIVDDDAEELRRLQRLLTVAGYVVSQADDGLAALTLARATRPDLLLITVKLRGVDGLVVCREVKSGAATRACQVMLVTEVDSESDRLAGLDAGADDLVSRPIQCDAFLAKVRALLRVRRLVDELELARAELTERNRELQLKRLLAQTLVHDLKNPLAAILGNLELLERKAPGPLADLVQRSRDGARRMRGMILDLLDVEQMEEGGLQTVRVIADVRALLDEALEEQSRAAERRGVRVELAVEGAPRCVADPHLVRRIVDNLVSQAIQHSPVHATVLVDARRHGDAIEIRVTDQGATIPASMREKVFEKYARAETRAGGLSAVNRGLGLTFCRLAAEGQGGSIVLDATECGARFRLNLPAEDAIAG